MLLDKMVGMFLDEMKDVYPEDPYITGVSESHFKHIHSMV